MKKKHSLQRRLTLWFSAALIFMALIAFVTVFIVSHSVLQKLLRDELVHTVEDNLDEVEFYRSIQQMDLDGDTDHFIRYGVGFLEIDDDFLDQVNGVYTALYHENGELLYGENPVSESSIPFEDGVCRTIRANGETYYVFDRQLEQSPIRDLWLRGIVAESQGDAPLLSIVHICVWSLGAFALIAIAGGVLIARRALMPIREMSLAAAQISGGDDLKKRMPVNESGDELAQLATAFNDMMQRLDESFEAEKQFASDASHELRTPMTVIMAQCDEALESEKTAAEYRDAIRVIRRQGKRMSRMITGMLELVRMERKTDLYPKAQFDLSELVQSVCEDMALIREKEISLSWKIEPDIAMIGDRTLLTRLLSNLIGNAYRYGVENGHIEVSLRKNGDCIELTVADDGIGIPPEQQEKIFHRLYQGASDRSGDGAGLGLSMARQIARMYSGELSVQSEPGKGSAFTARFPA